MGENALGIHALVWTGSWDEAACRDAMRRTAAAGFDLIEIPLLDPATVDSAMTREVAAEHGLRTTFTTGLSSETDISSTSSAVVRAGATLLQRALEVVHDCGSDYLGGVIYSAMKKYRVPPTAAGRANAVAVLRDLCDAAAARRTTIGLEAVNRYESNLLNTANQTLALIDEIGRDAVTVHLDAYHMNIEETSMADPVRQCAAAGRLGYVHIGESHRGYLGTGSVDLRGLFGALRAVGYGGPVVFESFSSAVVSQAFTAALGIWREPWQDADDLARHARRTIQAHLHAADVAVRTNSRTTTT